MICKLLGTCRVKETSVTYLVVVSLYFTRQFEIGNRHHTRFSARRLGSHWHICCTRFTALPSILGVRIMRFKPILLRKECQRLTTSVLAFFHRKITANRAKAVGYESPSKKPFWIPARTIFIGHMNFGTNFSKHGGYAGVVKPQSYLKFQ